MWNRSPIQCFKIYNCFLIISSISWHWFSRKTFSVSVMTFQFAAFYTAKFLWGNSPAELNPAKQHTLFRQKPGKLPFKNLDCWVGEDENEAEQNIASFWNNTLYVIFNDYIHRLEITSFKLPPPHKDSWKLNGVIQKTICGDAQAFFKASLSTDFLIEQWSPNLVQGPDVALREP